MLLAENLLMVSGRLILPIVFCNDNHQAIVIEKLSMQLYLPKKKLDNIVLVLNVFEIKQKSTYQNRNRFIYDNKTSLN